MNHRRDTPFIIAVFLLLGIFPDIKNAIINNKMGSLIPALLIGGLVGGALSYGSASWIKRNEKNGEVYFSFFNEASIIVVWLALISFWWPIVNKKFPKLCVALGANGVEKCIAEFSAFQSSLEGTLLCSLYVWGILYERRKSFRLVYRFQGFGKKKDMKN